MSTKQQQTAFNMQPHVERYCGAAGDRRSDVTDMLTDLRHYCAVHKVPFGACLKASVQHYNAERPQPARRGSRPDEAEIRAINREFRAKDESCKGPISGKFNATERAIDKAMRIRAQTGDNSGYRELLESLISDIVNKEATK